MSIELYPSAPTNLATTGSTRTSPAGRPTPASACAARTSAQVRDKEREREEILDDKMPRT